jgi:phage antirepressor YoqD-like protein
VTADDLGELVRLMQAHTPLCQLSNMEARTVFEFLQQRGYLISKKGDK